MFVVYVPEKGFKHKNILTSWKTSKNLLLDNKKSKEKQEKRRSQKITISINLKATESFEHY